MNVMVRLIDDLLDVARISSGKVTLQRECLDLRKALDAAVEGAKPLIDHAAHVLSISQPPEPVWVMGDATRLAQVVGNLLNNAAKYTPNGGQIQLGLTVSDGFAEVTVSDNGVGIPADLLGHVFRMFAQVNRTLDRAQGGLGIGLSLVHRLMEMHGGSVSAASDGVDQGSRFTVKLPLATPADASNDPAPMPQPASVASACRILVVDDNRDAADLLSLLLSSEGHQTRTEYSGSRALAAADEFRPRVVFCDIGMPELNGHQFAARLKENPLHAATLLVAITGWGSDDDRRQSQRAGFDFHLTKPVRADALAEVLQQI
jgi:CheY-like chemotaxis protein